MPLTPQVTITANLRQITGALDAASATFELVNFGSTVPRISGTCLILQISTTAVADGSGNISVTLWGNDVITPSGTYYTVTYYNESGGQAASVAYQFVGSGSFDLSTLIPIGEKVVANQTPNSAIPAIFNPISHQFLTGMNSLGQFSSAQPAFSDISGVIVGSQLPTPTSGTLGGVKALAAVGGLFVTGIGTDGVPTTGTPSFTIPNPSPTTLGGIESFAAVSHQWINSISTSGVPSATQPAFSDISGTASTGQIPNLPATIITSGLLALARGGTNADLSATGGAHQVLKQSSIGAAITVGQLAAADLSDTATTGNVLRGNGTSFVSAALAAADLSNGVTGSGSVVLATSPTLTTPTIGAATATSINKVAITAPATSATLTLANGKTLTVNNTLTFAGTDSTTLTFQGTGTVMNRDSTDTITNKTVGTGGLAGLTPKFQQFTSSGTFTIPTGVTAVKVIVVGAGGAGGGGGTSLAGGGGGSGSIGIKWLSGLTPGNTLTVTVGTGGTGVSAGNGNTGGASSVASGTQTITTISTNGGGGGFANGATSAGGASGTTGSGGDINVGGTGGSIGTGFGGNGAPGIFGGGGQSAGGGTTGNTAVGPGAGGSGAGPGTNQAGGGGANGIVIFEWVI